MKKIFFFFISLLLLTLFNLRISFGQLPPGIFHDSVYASVEVTSNILYGGNFNHSTGVYEDLLLDIYQPTDSINYLRPMLMYVHGGGFTSGNKTTDKAIDYGNYFAKRGYLVASIDYRLSIEIQGSTDDNYQSVYQATQDAKAAVRFFKKNANDYCLDTAAFFITGTSAGGSTAAMVAYWDQSEADVSIDTTVFGTFEASGNEGYSNSINSTIICWGATTDTTWLKGETEPNLIFHGTADPVIPYTSGYNIDSVFLYGGLSIYNAGIDYGIETYLHPFYGAGHGVPKNSPQFDTIFMMSTDFMFNHLPADIGSLCDVADNSPNVVTSNNDLLIYPNPSDGKFFIKTFHTINNKATIRIYSATGQMIESREITFLGNEENEFDFSALKPGIYFLHFITAEETTVIPLIIQQP